MYHYISKNSSRFQQAKRTASLLLYTIFRSMRCLISTPLFTIEENKIKITVFFYIRSRSKQLLDERKISHLHRALLVLFKSCSTPNWVKVRGMKIIKPKTKKLRVELQLIRLQYPFISASIFAQWLAIAISIRKLYHLKLRSWVKLGKVVGKIVDAKSVQSSGSKVVTHLQKEEKIASHGIGGLRIQISGKLTTANNRPRYTVRSYYIGSISGENVSFSQYTTKNKLGSFTVKVWLSDRMLPGLINEEE